MTNESESSKVSENQDAFADDNLTYDEAKALEMYGALKKKGRSEEFEEESEDDKNPEETPDDSALVDGDEARRSITYEMEKNKGLAPKRSKLQRNPRVKHRVKFAKAKVRRKGQVREVRKETKKYGGEMFGINARVKKGVKLA